MMAGKARLTRLMVSAAAGFCAALASDAAAQGSVETDRAALEAFYDATDGANWTDGTNWKTSAPLGEWYGVTTDGAGRVTWLNLAGNGLTGPMPRTLGNLALLQGLDLGSRFDFTTRTRWDNALTGAIPAELGNLVNLVWLDLDQNTLTGAIPAELGNLVNLEVLNLIANELTGPVPAWMGDLLHLRRLHLGWNELTGPIPGDLANLTSLRELGLDYNTLTGSIPAELGNLVNLEVLRLRGNELTGAVPAWLGNLGNLDTLLLGQNQLTGAIPSELGRLVRLHTLGLDSNELTGPVPAWMGNLPRLAALYLDENHLAGVIPGELGNLVNLEVLHLFLNPLTEALPQRLTLLSELFSLRIEHTDACAPADAEFQAWLATLEEFQGDTCNSPPEPVGAIPGQALTESGAATGVSMEEYFSDPNDDPLTYAATSSRASTATTVVSGDTVWLVPGSAGTATVTVTARDPDGLSATQTIQVTVAASAGPQSDRDVLEILYDSTGGAGWTDRRNWKTPAPLSEWYGVATDGDGRVTELNLVANGLAGLVPPALGNLVNLTSLDLIANELTGRIPVALGRLKNLRDLKLAWNKLTGPIPAALGNLMNLEVLNLSANSLTGPVPVWLGNMSRLRVLFLDGNDLTGGIPDELGKLVNLRLLRLSWNDLSVGAVPNWLGNLTNVRSLDLAGSGLTGRIPDGLGRLTNLHQLNLSYNWGLSGPLPRGLRLSHFSELDIFLTQTCAPVAWGDRLATIEFMGRLCDMDTDATIDVAVVYTRAAREEEGGVGAIEALIDLVIAETNQALSDSGVHHRLRLVESAEVAYDETGDSLVDLPRLTDPSDGHMDEVHAMRDRVGADLVSLMVGESDVCGRAYLAGAFSLTVRGCAFTHELGHNMGLLHDRYQVHHHEDGVRLHPAYGYVNQRAFEAGAPRSRRWATIMSYGTQCLDAYFRCWGLFRFSNPRQRDDSDPLGIPFGSGGSGVTGPADAAAVLNATAPAVALWRDRPASANRPPAAVSGALPDATLALSGTLTVDVSAAFVDPDGDLLTYEVSSSAPDVVTVRTAGARVTLTAVGRGTATIRVTATDRGGLSATRAFTVTVAVRAPFTDDPIVPGVTPIKAVHFTELRARIEALRREAGLAPFGWTDPVVRAGVTPVRLAHLLELREALAEAYAASGRAAPRWTDPVPVGGTSPIRAAHLTELRAAVVALK